MSERRCKCRVRTHTHTRTVMESEMMKWIENWVCLGVRSGIMPTWSGYYQYFYQTTMWKALLSVSVMNLQRIDTGNATLPALRVRFSASAGSCFHCVLVFQLAWYTGAPGRLMESTYMHRVWLRFILILAVELHRQTKACLNTCFKRI